MSSNPDHPHNKLPPLKAGSSSAEGSPKITIIFQHVVKYILTKEKAILADKRIFPIPTEIRERFLPSYDSRIHRAYITSDPLHFPWVELAGVDIWENDD